MKSARLNRLFNSKSKRCFDVAVDHGFFNEHDFLAGIENMRKAIDVLIAAAPDAIQLTVGLAPLLQEIPGRNKPSLVLRTDVANVYGKDLSRTLFSRMIQSPVEQALRLDATCVVVNLFQIPNQPEVADQCVQNILAIKPECERYGMPLMIEPLVFQPAFQQLPSPASRRARQRFCKKRANTDQKRKNFLKGKSKVVGNSHALAIASNRLVTSATRLDAPSMRGRFSGRAS